MKKLSFISLAVLAFSLQSCRKDYLYVAPPAPPVTTTVHFSTDVYPLLITSTAQCNAGCHDGTSSSGLDFMTLSGAYNTLTSTSNVIAGNATGSNFYKALADGTNPSGFMPAGVSSSQFTSSELEIVKAWINQGALNN